MGGIKMKKILLSIMFISLGFITACNIPSHHSTLDAFYGIEVGTSKPELLQRVKDNDEDNFWEFTNKSEFNISVQNKQYQIFDYATSTSNYSYSSTSSTSIGSPSYGTTTYTSTTYHSYRMYSRYIFTFKENKLIYWGFLYEYLRHPDPEIAAIGNTLRLLYQSTYEEELY